MTGTEIATALIKQFESCRLNAYILPGEKWVTIGFGHALPLKEIGAVITQDQAEALLDQDLNSRNAELKNQLGSVYAELNPGQLGATLSFKFNCMPTLFDSSTFLSLLKQGKMSLAQAEFKRWIYGEGHQVLPGLVRRRECEAFIFGGSTIGELIERSWFL